MTCEKSFGVKYQRIGSNMHIPALWSAKVNHFIWILDWYIEFGISLAAGTTMTIWKLECISMETVSNLIPVSAST